MDFSKVDLSRVVSAGVGPIIVISACGLLSSTFYNRMTNVISRLRAFQRERLAEQLLLDKETDDTARNRRREMLDVLGEQSESLVRRVRLIRRTLFCLLATIASLVLCSLSLGLSVILGNPLLILAIAFFVLGLGLLLGAIAFAMLDLKMAMDPVVLETTFVTKRVRRGEGI
jgi:hypothetical protein